MMNVYGETFFSSPSLSPRHTQHRTVTIMISMMKQFRFRLFFARRLSSAIVRLISDKRSFWAYFFPCSPARSLLFPKRKAVSTATCTIRFARTAKSPRTTSARFLATINISHQRENSLIKHLHFSLLFLPSSALRTVNPEATTSYLQSVQKMRRKVFFLFCLLHTWHNRKQQRKFSHTRNGRLWIIY